MASLVGLYESSPPTSGIAEYGGLLKPTLESDVNTQRNRIVRTE